MMDFGLNDCRTSPIRPLSLSRFIIGKGTDPFFILVEGFVEMGICGLAFDHPVLCHILLAF